MERKSLAGLCFILLILVAARVDAEEYLEQAEDAEEYLVQAEDAEEYLEQAEDAEEYLVQAEDAEEYLVQARPKCGPSGSCHGCGRRCRQKGCRHGRCIRHVCFCFP